jgi:hypothetical protein
MNIKRVSFQKQKNHIFTLPLSVSSQTITIAVCEDTDSGRVVAFEKARK